MQFKFHYALLLLVPFATQVGCSSSNDDSSSGGAGGISAGAGGTAGRANGGAGGVARGGGGAGGSLNQAGSTSGGTAGTLARGGSSGASTAGGIGGSTSGGAGAGNGGTAANGGSAGHAGSGGSSGSGGGSAGRAGSGGSIGEGGAGGSSEVALDDAEIIKVVTTLDDGEIAAGDVALTGAQATAVKTFAQTMVSDHSGANSQVLALVASKHIAPRTSDLSDRLENEAAAALTALSAASTTTFDRTYMDMQIQMHQEALGLLDAELLPQASDADLKALLTNIRATVAAHLATALSVRAAL